MRCQDILHTTGRCHVWGGQRHHCARIGTHTSAHRCVCKAEWPAVT